MIWYYQLMFTIPGVEVKNGELVEHFLYSHLSQILNTALPNLHHPFATLGRSDLHLENRLLSLIMAGRWK